MFWVWGGLIRTLEPPPPPPPPTGLVFEGEARSPEVFFLFGRAGGGGAREELLAWLALVPQK